jgi:Spy/CpxP family protein refolding chaperone
MNTFASTVSRTALSLGVAFLASVSPALAAAPPTSADPAPQHDTQRLQKRLGLTDDQAAKIQAIQQQNRDAFRQTGASLRKAQADLRQMALNGADATALQAKTAEVQQLLGQMVQLRVQTLQQVSPILTPEQRQKMAQLDTYGRGHHRRHGAPESS